MSYDHVFEILRQWVYVFFYVMNPLQLFYYISCLWLIMTSYGFKDEVAPWNLNLYVDLLLINACWVCGCYTKHIAKDSRKNYTRMIQYISDIILTFPKIYKVKQ